MERIGRGWLLDAFVLTVWWRADRQEAVSLSQKELFEAALRPMGDDAETRLAAISLLERISPESADGAGQAVARWESVDAGRKSRWGRWLFLAVLVLFSAWAWGVAGMEALVYKRWYDVPANYRYDDPSFYPEAVTNLNKCLPGGLDERQRMMLLGGPAKGSRVESMRALWDSAPEDPAFHMEYVVGSYEEPRKTRAVPDFLETARRLDPGNAWPVYVAGTVELYGAINDDWRSRKSPPEWRIDDPGKLDRCIALLHEASGEPGFDTYQKQLIEMRKELLPVEDHLGYLVAHKVAWFGYWANHEPSGYLGVFWGAAAAKSQQLAADGDKEGFVRLMSDMRILNQRWLAGDVISAGSEMYFAQSMGRALPRLHASAVSLGLPKEAARLEEMMKPLPERADDTRVEYGWFESRSPALLSTFRRFYTEYWHPQWSVTELGPGRMADHELLSRGCSMVLWLLFALLLGGLAIYQFRLPRLMRRMGARTALLLDVGDHLRIVAGGVLLPFLLVMAVNWFTPWGGRDWSIVGNHFMLPMAHYLCLAVLMIVLPVILLRRRLAVRAGVLGLRVERSFWLWLVVAFAALLVPVIGWIAPHERFADYLPALAGVVFLLVGFGLAKICIACFYPGELRLLRGAVASRALFPAYASVMLLMAIAAPVHKAAERKWFQRDTTMTSVPGFPGVSPYDYRVAEQTRRHIREMPELK